MLSLLSIWLNCQSKRGLPPLLVPDKISNETVNTAALCATNNPELKYIRIPQAILNSDCHIAMTNCPSWIWQCKEPRKNIDLNILFSLSYFGKVKIWLEKSEIMKCLVQRDHLFASKNLWQIFLFLDFFKFFLLANFPLSVFFPAQGPIFFEEQPARQKLAGCRGAWQNPSELS